jgi:hypothetical protein
MSCAGGFCRAGAYGIPCSSRCSHLPSGDISAALRLVVWRGAPPRNKVPQIGLALLLQRLVPEGFGIGAHETLAGR